MTSGTVMVIGTGRRPWVRPGALVAATMGMLVVGPLAPRPSHGFYIPGGAGGGAEPPAKTRTAEKTFKAGKDSYLSASMTDKASVSARTSQADSTLSKELRGCIAGECVSIATGALEAHSTGGSRASFMIGPWEVFTLKVDRSGEYGFGPYLLNVPVAGQKIDIIPGVSATSAVSLGAGVQFGGTWGLEASPARADLNATAETFANAAAEAAVQVGKRFKGSLQAIFKVFNPKLILQANGSYDRVESSGARIDLTPWELLVRAVGKVKLLGKSWSLDKTLFNESGPPLTIPLF